MVIKQTKASADNGLGIRRPGKPHAWRDVVFFVKSGIIIPAHACVYGQIAPDLPIVLNPETVIVVSQMNFVGLRSEPAKRQEQKETRIDRAELFIIGLSCEQLIIL